MATIVHLPYLLNMGRERRWPRRIKKKTLHIGIKRLRSKNMSCWSVNSFDFSSENSNESTDQQDMFCFNHASTFYTSNNIVKMLINNKFKAQTLTGNPTGNYRYQLLSSRTLNMSCSFSQSARSIESRCVVMCLPCYLVKYPQH